jgi:hypothetical protein
MNGKDTLLSAPNSGSVVMGSPVPSGPFPSPALNALITYALAEATWAEKAIHATMTASLRKHHEYHSHMHLAIARRLEELKELTEP